MKDPDDVEAYMILSIYILILNYDFVSFMLF